MKQHRLGIKVNIEPGEKRLAQRAKVYDAKTGEEYVNIFAVEETEVDGFPAVTVTFGNESLPLVTGNVHEWPGKIDATDWSIHLNEDTE